MIVIRGNLGVIRLQSNTEYAIHLDQTVCPNLLAISVMNSVSSKLAIHQPNTDSEIPELLTKCALGMLRDTPYIDLTSDTTDKSPSNHKSTEYPVHQYVFPSDYSPSIMLCSTDGDQSIEVATDDTLGYVGPDFTVDNDRYTIAGRPILVESLKLIITPVLNYDDLVDPLQADKAFSKLYIVLSSTRRQAPQRLLDCPGLIVRRRDAVYNVYANRAQYNELLQSCQE